MKIPENGSHNEESEFVKKSTVVSFLVCSSKLMNNVHMCTMAAKQICEKHRHQTSLK